jgi:branched-chain amino acid transport system ATP-binding protein
VPLLRVEGLAVFYGKIQALRNLSFFVEPGEIVALVGSNGVGKTTTLKTVVGTLRPRAGNVIFDGKRIDGRQPHEIVRAGIALVPEGRRIFPFLTVRENLELGAYARRERAAVRTDLERVLALFPRLHERLAQLGGTLSGGEQQMLAIGRAMMSRPKLLLLDEPSMGLAPMLINTIFHTIQEINEAGTTILLVEQNAAMALSLAHRGYVLQAGQVALSGSGASLLRDETVRRTYLGARSPAAPT